MLISENQNLGTILINPVFNVLFEQDFKDIDTQRNMQNKLSLIFTGKSFLFLKNKNLKALSTLYEKNSQLDVNIIENSRKSFKYYETMLLAMIIKILEQNPTPS